jgi:UrcA family protein
MRKFLFPAIAASLVAPLSSVAAAEKVTEVVSFADLDLRTDDGLNTLEERIAAAVIVVCGAPSDFSPWAKRAVEECRAEAADDAKAQLEEHLASLAPMTVAAAD